MFPHGGNSACKDLRVLGRTGGTIDWFQPGRRISAIAVSQRPTGCDGRTREPQRPKVSAEQPEGADDDSSDADQRPDDGPRLNEHCAIDSRFQRGDLSPQFGDAGIEPLRRDVLAVVRPRLLKRVPRLGSLNDELHDAVAG